MHLPENESLLQASPLASGGAGVTGVTPAVLFQVAWAQVIAECSSRDDVVFGTVLSGRLQGSDAADQVIGMFINSLPMRHKAVQDIQSLLKYLARAGVLTMLIVAQHGLLGENMGTDIDVSFLGDTVLFLRLQESEGSLRRTITVVKKRHGPHLMQVQELIIDSSGVQVLSFNPLPDVG